MHNEHPPREGTPRKGAAREGAPREAQPLSPTLATSSPPPSAPASTARRHRGWRVLGGVALAAVLGLAFWGYTTPDMQIHWENLAALCGF